MEATAFDELTSRKIRRQKFIICRMGYWKGEGCAEREK
jgi:hypothetical protein